MMTSRKALHALLVRRDTMSISSEFILDFIRLADHRSTLVTPSMPSKLFTTLAAYKIQFYLPRPIKFYEILGRLEPNSCLPRNFFTLESTIR